MKNYQEKNGKCEDYRITNSSNLNNSKKWEMAVSSGNGGKVGYASAKSSQVVDFKLVAPIAPRNSQIAKLHSSRYYKALVSIIALFVLCNFNALSQTLTITFTDTNGDGILSDPEVVAQTNAAQIPSNTPWNAIVADGITTLGNSAFIYWSYLTEVTLPNSLTTIGNSVFRSCFRLRSITIPNSVTSMGNDLFWYCDSLRSVTLSNSLTTIGESVFRYCTALPSITIPNGITSIGNNAFSDCRSLTSITFAAPSSLTTIGNSAFSYSGLTSITLPNSLTTISPYTFQQCTSLTSVTLPSSLTTIGSDAFSYCTGLTSVTFPNPSNLTSIGPYAFAYCSALPSITIPNGVTTIGDRAFTTCRGLTSITLPNTLTTINYYAFYNCTALPSITIPNGVTTLQESAFENCTTLTSITLPNSLTTIGTYVFYYCRSLRSITIPNSVTSIGNQAFRGCTTLTSVTLPNSLTTIGVYTFYECTALPRITIPANVTSVGAAAFTDCTSLRILEFLGATPPTTLGINANVPIDTIFVPSGTSNAYRARFLSAGYDNETASKIFVQVSLVINTSPNIGGTTTTTNAIRHPEGINGAIEAIPNDCYHFTNWTNRNGDIVSEYNPFIIDVISDTVLTANFDLNIYSLSVNADNPSHGRVNGAGNYDCGTNAVLTAYPAEGHIFTNWTDVDDNNHILSTANPHTIAIRSNRSIRANFDALPNATFTLIITPSAGGSVTTNPTNTTNLVNGTQVTFTAYPDAGYRFVNWTGENISSTLNPETIVMRTDRTIRANFELLPPNTTATLTISTSNGGGVTTNPPNTTNIPIGTEITLTANPNTCYRFKEWSNGSTESQINLTLTSDMDLTAIFESSEATYNLQVISNGNGTVTGAENNVPCGATRQIRAMPVSSCYRFTGWSNGSTANPLELDITSDMNLVASFAIVQYNLSVSAGTGGSVNISGTNPRDCGSTTSLSATADAGYKFLNWTSGGVEISTNIQLNITIASDTSLVANFEVNEGGVFENNLISSIRITPNPVTSEATIEINSVETQSNTTLSIIDLSGKEVVNIYVGILDTGITNFTLPNNLVNGNYFLLVKNKNGQKTHSFIVTK